MAKITISQLQTADTTSIKELTNAEIDATKGGLLPPLPVDIFGFAFGVSGFALDTVSSAASSAQLYVTEGLPKSIGMA
jgi:hypothetical protein